MKRLAVLFLAIPMLVPFAVADNCENAVHLWARKAAEGGTCLVRDIAVFPDGSQVVAGSFAGVVTFGAGQSGETVLTAANEDMFLARYALDGSLLWIRQGAGSNFVWAWSVAIAPDGSIAVAGHANDSMTFGAGEPNEVTVTGGQEGFIARYDGDGTFLWVRRATSTGGTSDATDIAVGGDGAICATGYFTGTLSFGGASVSVPSAGVFVVRFDANGNEVWTNAEGDLGADAFGHGIAADETGSCYVAGEFGGTVTFGAGEPNETTLSASGTRDAFVAAYAADGSVTWVRRVGGSDSSVALDVSVLRHRLLVAGAFRGSIEIETTYLPATLESGGFTDIFAFWCSTTTGLAHATSRLGGAGHENAVVATQTRAGTGYLAFVADGNTRVAAIDVLGEPVWSIEATGSLTSPQGIALDAVGSVFVGGTYSDGDLQLGSETLPGAGTQGFLWRLAAPANLAWAKTATSPSQPGAGDVAEFPDGTIVNAGDFGGSITLGAGEANETTLTAANEGAYFARHAPDGTLVSARVLATSRDLAVGEVAAQPDGSYFVMGVFRDSVTLDPGGPNETTRVAGISGPFKNGWIARFDANDALLWVRTLYSDALNLNDFAVMPDGSLIVAGGFGAPLTLNAGETDEAGLVSAGGFDIFLFRMAPDGALDWSRSIGGTGFDAANSIDAYFDGSFLVTGFFRNTVDFGGTSLTSPFSDLWVARYDPAGPLLWVRQAGASGVDVNGLAASTFPDGSSMVAGRSTGNAAFIGGHALEPGLEAGTFAARLDAGGSVMRVDRIAGMIGLSDLATASDNSYAICGWLRGDVTFNPGTDRSFVVTGVGTADQDILVACFNRTGDALWARANGSFSGSTGEFAIALAMAGDGSIYANGLFVAEAVFGRAEHNETTLTAPSQQYFFAKWHGLYAIEAPAELEGEVVDGVPQALIPVLRCGELPNAGFPLSIHNMTNGARALSNTLPSSPPGTLLLVEPLVQQGWNEIELVAQHDGRVMARAVVNVLIGDATPPVLTGCGPKTIELTGPQTTLYKSVLGIDATDDTDPSPTITFSPTAVPFGTTTVIATATDAAGNASSCTFDVTVVDTTPPEILSPAGDLEFECQGPDGASVVIDVFAVDLSGQTEILGCTVGGFAVNPGEPLQLPVGEHAGECVVTDPYGNVAALAFTVSVIDSVAPVLVCPPPVVVPNEPGECFAFVDFHVEATDSCDPNVAITYEAPWGPTGPGDAFPVGQTVLIATAVDLGGNQASCTFSIVVLDLEPPQLSGPANVTFTTDHDGTPVSLVDELTPYLQATDNCPGVTVTITPTTAVPGTTPALVTARDAVGFQVSITVDVLVLTPAEQETPTGGDVTVTPEAELPDGSISTVEVNFSRVDADGVTSVSATQDGPAPPDGFQLGDSGIYYDVETTATFSGDVELCFSWAEGDIANEGNLRLFHYVNGAWTDITSSVDTTNNIVCGVTQGLSPFLVAEIEYEFGGIEQPVNADGSSIFKQGRTIPLKFQLFGPDGAVVPTVTARLRVIYLGSTVLGTVEEEVDAEAAGFTHDDGYFRYDETKEQYIYNLKTDNLATGSYRFEFLLDDGSVHTVLVSLR